MRGPDYSPTEDAAILRMLAWNESVHAIGAAIGRSGDSVRQRARVLGRTGSGIPDGWESIKAASRRAGFNHQTLARILAWAKVTTRYYGMRTSSTCRCVPMEQVDAAVKRWLDLEVLGEAARRRRVSRTQLEVWLREAGIEFVRAGTRGSFSWVRVNGEDVDRVLRERAARYESRAAAAERLGVEPPVLKDWLVRCGVSPRSRKLIERSFFDEVAARCREDRRAA